jgi:hypothetical protein
MNPSTVALLLTLIDYLALAMGMAPKVKRDYDLLAIKIREMVAEGRDPTREEWDELHRRIARASDRLRAVDAALNAD